MNTAEHLFEKYGPLLSTTDLAEVFKYKSPRCVQNAIYNEAFPSRENPLPTTHLHHKRIVANYKDVADYIDSLK